MDPVTSTPRFEYSGDYSEFAKYHRTDDFMLFEPDSPFGRQVVANLQQEAHENGETIHYNNAVCICKNKMHFTQTVYSDLSTEYKRKYAQWMDRAVSYFIDYVDKIPEPCILHELDENAKKV